MPLLGFRGFLRRSIIPPFFRFSLYHSILLAFRVTRGILGSSVITVMASFIWSVFQMHCRLFIKLPEQYIQCLHEGLNLDCGSVTSQRKLVTLWHWRREWATTQHDHTWSLENLYPEVIKLQFFITLTGLMRDNNSLHTKEIYNARQKSLAHLDQTAQRYVDKIYVSIVSRLLNS